MEDLNRRSIWLECCVRLSTKWSILATSQLNPDDDYPDFVVPLARAVARGEVDRGVAICGSGVGACIAANKVPGVHACLIHESFSAHQGVEDDDMNVMCLGGRVVAKTFSWELVRTFLEARFSGAERHRQRQDGVPDLQGNIRQRPV